MLDEDFRLLEISDDATIWQGSELIRISSNNLSYTKVGMPIKFGGENALSREEVSDVLSRVSGFLYAADVDYISFDDKYNIYFTCGERFKIVLGGKDDISTKLNKAELMMQMYENSDDNGLVINVFDPNEPFVGHR